MTYDDRVKAELNLILDKLNERIVSLVDLKNSYDSIILDIVSGIFSSQFESDLIRSIDNEYFNFQKKIYSVLSQHELTRSFNFSIASCINDNLILGANDIINHTKTNIINYYKLMTYRMIYGSEIIPDLTLVKKENIHEGSFLYELLKCRDQLNEYLSISYSQDNKIQKYIDSISNIFSSLSTDIYTLLTSSIQLTSVRELILSNISTISENQLTRLQELIIEMIFNSNILIEDITDADINQLKQITDLDPSYIDRLLRSGRV